MRLNRLEIEQGKLPKPYRRPKERCIPGEFLFPSIQETERELPSRNALSIYCHIPFCRTRCAFCDLYTFTLSGKNLSFAEEYVDALTEEILLWSQTLSLKKRPITTIHFGGGTPSCLPIPLMDRILEALHKNLSLQNTEIALEMPGSDLNESYRSYLRAAGIQRIHLGVQSLNDSIRQKIGRKISAWELLNRISGSLEERFILSVDLIFGLPGQTLENFQEDIKMLIGIGVHGFSLYELQVPHNNAHGINTLPHFQKDRRLAHLMFREGKEQLEAIGYRQNYFVHFSLPPDQNLYCTFPLRGEDCLAWGAISDGQVGNWSFTNHRLEGYLKNIRKGQAGIESGYLMNEKERWLRALETRFLSTNIPEGFIAGMSKAFPPLAEMVSLWVQEDLLRRIENNYRLTTRGCWFLGNMFDDLRDRIFSEGAESEDENILAVSEERRPDKTPLKKTGKGDSSPEPRTLHAMKNLGEWKLTEEVFVIPDNENFILYAPAVKGVLLVNEKAVQVLRHFNKGGKDYFDGKSPFWAQMVQAGIIVPEQEESPRVKFPDNPRDFDPEEVSLFLTTKCSMRCIYCYSSGGEHPRLMPWETAQAAIGWLIQHVRSRGKDRFTISFHGGGEVTLAGILMKRCVAYAREQAKAHGLKVRIRAGLNGVMSPAMRDWVARNIDSATVSLDGIPEVQNHQRPLSNGRNSSTAVYSTLKYLDSKSFNYGLRSTVTQESLGRLEESVEFMCQNFQTQMIQIEPVFQAGRARRNRVTPVVPREFVEQYRKAQTVARSYGKELKYSGARLQTITNTFCLAATGNSFCVTPDGLVTSCYEVSNPEDPRAALFLYGHLDFLAKAFSFDEDKIQKLLSLRVENKPHCKNCFCKWHCAGDCPAKLALLGNAWDPSLNPRCYIIQELTKDQLKERLS
jgi:uncharacterized protein